ncbi:acyltransferase [Duganella sp. HH101]|uniref:acyltransferase family protein n=1 Tax=Duganella sp. HH101 TaxID=1781066 RepID=UPI00087456C8|nr:acyltransferase [Duganella sp. HH101]OFA00297.1 O-acetyltransferase OatA [Duganella sp. HH101]
MPVSERKGLAGNPGRYPVLDALRAVAILLVLARHWAVASQGAFGVVPGGPLAVLSLNGWLGVDLFFVLSGFLIGTHFAGPQAQPFSRAAVLDFYRRRAFRTLPLYWGVILLCWLTAPWRPGAAFTSLSFVTHLLFLQDYLGSDAMVTLWSLAVEEKFYLAAPLLLFMLLRLRTGVACVLLAAAMGLVCWSMQAGTAGVAPGDYAAFFWTVRAPFHHAVPGILAGVLVAVQHGASSARQAPRPLFLALAALPLMLLMYRDWLGRSDWPAVCSIIVLSSCLFALLVRCGLAVNCRLPAFGAARPLRYIAKLSYALYLVHYPLIAPAMLVCRALPDGLAPATASLLFLAIYGAMSWAAAWLLHVALERPFLLLRDRRRAGERSVAI